MSILWTRVRARAHLWRRTLVRYRVTAMGVVLAGYSATTAFGDPPVAVSVATAAAGLVVAGLEIRSNRLRSRAVRFQRRETDDYGDLLAGFAPVVRTQGDVGLLMAEETARIRRESVPVSVDDTPFAVHPDMERFAVTFLARRLRRSVMFNGPTLGLRTDVPPSGDEAVAVRPARYFDFVATNLLSPYDVHEVGRAVPVLRGRDLIFNSAGRLRGFRHSRLANTIGVSTLAFTCDGKLLLVCQTVDVAGSPGLIAPSASGALEPRDVPQTGPVALQQLVLAGAHRELREECSVAEEDIEEGAEVVGYGRWVSRGAMPEFCAVTLLNRSADEILARRVRRGERVYVGDVLAVRLPPVPDWSAVTGPDLLRDGTLRHAVSWPLAFALTCLADAVRDPSWKLGERLRERLAQA